MFMFPTIKLLIVHIESLFYAINCVFTLNYVPSNISNLKNIFLLKV